MRYRYARMAAMNEPIPEVDRKIQAPEGLRVRSLMFLLQDKTVGVSFRLMRSLRPGLEFDSYLRWFVCVFSSIPVIAVFLAGSTLWRSRFIGVVGACLYSVSVPAMERVIANYLREEFALPFIFLSFSFFLASVSNSESGRKSNIYGFLAGASIFISLSAWHLTGFYLLVFLIGATLVTFLRPDLKQVQRPLLYVVGFGVLAGALNEPLRVKMFLVSMPMMLGYCLVVSYAVFARFRTSRRVAAALLAVLVIASLLLVSVLSPSRGEYGHVYSLILSKARFLLNKPADPSLLSPDARLLWLGPFQSPSLFSFLFGFAALFAVAIYATFGVLRRWMKGATTQGEMLLIYMSIVFLVLYLFVRRLEVFLIFFVVLIVAGALKDSGKKKMTILAALLSVLFLFEAYKVVTFAEATPLKEALLKIKRPEVESPSIHDRDKGEIFRRIKSSTPTDAVFLARFATSPMIVTYGERASVLHPIFETRQIRERVLECASAFYGLEDELKRVCSKYGVDYVLYEANQLLDNSELGDRYFTDNLKLMTSSVAFLMHFAPEWLRHFDPVYQTDYFRVFVVRDRPRENIPTPVLLPYSVQYDASVFGIDKMWAVFSDSLVAEAWQSMEEAFALSQKGGEFMKQGLYEKAAEYYGQTLELLPRLVEVRFALAECYRRMERHDLSAATYREMIQIDPYNIAAYTGLAAIYREQDLFTIAVEALEEGLMILPGNLYLMHELAATNIELGDTTSAIAQYMRMLELAPSRDDIRRALEELEH